MGCGSSSRVTVATPVPSSPTASGPDVPNDEQCASSSTREPDYSNKFGGDDKLQKLSGGTLQDYHDNLKCLSGMPAAALTDDFLLKQMKAEHCYMSGFNTSFDCSLHYEAVHPNEDAPTTCAKEEWEYAVDGKVPKYIASGKFRLKELYSKAGRVSDIYRKTATGTAASDPLSPPERLGLALYTGPMFKVYNSILRRNVMKSSIADKFFRPNSSQQEVGKTADPSTAPYPSAAPSFGSYAALQSVYTSAQRLKLEIFERFDRDGNLCIEKKELNDVIHNLLIEKNLDDNMLRVLDYFSAVDQNGDNIVDFDEALKHCFPYVPDKHLVILKKWLHPEKYDKQLFQELTVLASKTTMSPSQTFEDSLKVLETECKDFVMRSKDPDRMRELQHVNQGFVSEFTLASILSHHGKMKEHASWKDIKKSQILESTDNTLAPNFFSTTIFAISSAIQTLSRLHSTSVSSSAASSNAKKQPLFVYRGYKDVIVPENFSGYCELGFLSSSKDKAIAEKIASQNDAKAAKNILILEIEAPIGGFADIWKYSQFPQEQEFIFAPLTYIKFTVSASDVAASTHPFSDSAPVSSLDSVSVSTSPVAPSFRRATVFPSPASTVKDMQVEEQSMHLQLFRFNRAELSQKLENRLNDWLNKEGFQEGRNGKLLHDVCKACDEKWMDTSTLPKQMRAVTTKQIFERILSQYDEVFEAHRQCSPGDFSSDDFFRDKVSQMLNSKRWCEHKLSLWIQNCENNGHDDMSIAIYFHPLDQCFKILLMTLRRSILDLRRKSAADANVQPSLKTHCADLLKAKGLISSEFDFSKEKNNILRVLGDASVNGWGEEDLLALLDLCHDVESLVVERIDSLSASCLHLAAAHGNSFFLSTVFSYLCRKSPGDVQILPQNIVHCQIGNVCGETPLYLAAENGHSTCIEVLIKYCPEVPEFSLSPLSAAISRSHEMCVQLLVKAALFSETAAQRLIHRSTSGFTPIMRAISRGHVGIVRLLLWAGADAEVQGAGASSCQPSQPAEITVQLMLDQKRHGGDAENSNIIKKLLEERKSCPTLSGYREQCPQVSKFFI